MAAPLAECDIRLDVSSAGVTWQRDPTAQPPVCLLLGEGEAPSPFVNSISVLRWSQLSELAVNGEPLRELGYFRVTRVGAVSAASRPSYADERQGYAQRVIRRSVGRPVVAAGGVRTVTTRTDLRVRWLKPEGARAKAEVQETWTCVDQARWSAERLVVANWCAPKGDAGWPAIDSTLRSIEVRSPADRR